MKTINQRENNSKAKVIEIYLLLAVDILCITLSYYLASYIRYENIHFDYKGQLFLLVYVVIVLFCVLYEMIVNYSRDFVKRGYLVEFMAVTKYNLLMLVVIGSALFLLKEADNFSRLFFGYFIIVNEVITFSVHIGTKKYLQKHYQSSGKRLKTLVITDMTCAHKLMEELLDKIDFMHEVTSVLIWDQELTGDNINGIPVIAHSGSYMDAIKLMPLDEVFIYLPDESRDTVGQLIMNFEMMGVVCHYNIDVGNLDSKARTVGSIAGFTVISYSMTEIDYNKRMLKRGMDIIGAVIGIVITAIFFPFVAVAIKIESKGPVLFSQKRVGKNGRVFCIYKFRSMYIDAEQRKQELMKQNEVKGLMFKIENDPRITKVGRFLRKTSIDELPQFFNVLKGDMSLIGTRPPTLDEYEKYNFYYKRRLSMTPGLTGLWQVSGRSEITDFDDVVKYDLEYIDNWSLTLDLKILLQTIGVVLLRKGSK